VDNILFIEIDIPGLLIKTFITFIVLMLLTRLLGKKQLSQLTYFNYVTGITIGSIAANIVCNSTEPFLDDLLGLAWWCILSGLVAYLGLKSGHFRRIADGQPTIVIKKGRIIKEALKKARLNMDDLSMLLREQGAFTITEVEYAILEPDGKLSVMKKQTDQMVSKSDLNLPLKEIKYIPSEIIVDGKVIKKDLKEFNLSDEWLDNQLKQQNINSVKEVFYAEIQSDGTLFIQKYE
jgi:uncharacterized membrane protein YcaP (DUF421 family)